MDLQDLHGLATAMITTPAHSIFMGNILIFYVKQIHNGLSRKLMISVHITVSL